MSRTEAEKARAGTVIAELDKIYLWHPFTQMKEWAEGNPLVIERAEGAYLYDVDGNRYLDAVASLWANVHGHRHPVIDEAVRAQLGRVAHTTLLGLTSPPAVGLAERLVKVAPYGLTRVFYAGDGACAVEAALKMSFQYWRQRGDRFSGKRRFMSFAGGYHGDTLGAVSVGGIDLFHEVYRELLTPSIKIPYAYCYRCHLGLEFPSCGLECLGRLEPLFERYHSEVAALVVEPKVQGAAGMVVAPDGFMRGLRDLCSKYELLLIADEVATGFGRTGRMFACDHDGVSPDIMCLGKGITGGYMALAATLTTDEIFEGFLGDHSERKTLFHGHTYAGNPLACAAGLASLDVFEKERVLEGLPRKAAYLEEKLAALRDLQCVGDVRQAGLMAGVEIVEDAGARARYPESARMGAKVTAAMRRRGVIARPLGDVVPLVLPLCVMEEDIELVVSALRDSLVECAPCCAGGA